MAFASILRKSANSLAPLAIRLTRVQRNYHSCIFTALNQAFRSRQSSVNRFYPNTLRFTTAVASKKSSSDESLVRVIESEIQCAEEDGSDQIAIDSLCFQSCSDAEDELAYEGPEFDDLDENLQKGFHKYLEVRGIKPNITNFLHEYMINKDNRDYLNWLKNLKKFVEE